MQQDEQYLSVQELAERYGLAVATVRNWRYEKIGPPYFKAGRTIRYRLSDVLTWENSRMTTEDRS